MTAKLTKEHKTRRIVAELRVEMSVYLRNLQNIEILNYLVEKMQRKARNIPSCFCFEISDKLYFITSCELARFHWATPRHVTCPT
jgi:hypothetical protein